MSVSSTCSGNETNPNSVRQLEGARLSSEVEVANSDNLSKIEDPYSIRVEFAINFNRQDDLKKIEEALELKGLKLDSADIDEKTVQVIIGVDTLEQHDVQSIQEFLEQSTGFTTVIKGFGQLASTVAELRPPASFGSQPVLGVVRLSQMKDSSCFVDGSITIGLTELIISKSMAQNNLRLLLAIHETGDLTGQSFETIGKPLIKLMEQTVIFDKSDKNQLTSLSTRKILPNCEVLAMIGRSVALSQINLSDHDESPRQILSAGVIARASTVGLNKKKVCTCSGKTLWEERIDRQQNIDDTKSIQ